MNECIPSPILLLLLSNPIPLLESFIINHGMTNSNVPTITPFLEKRVMNHHPVCLFLSNDGSNTKQQKKSKRRFLQNVYSFDDETSAVKSKYETTQQTTKKSGDDSKKVTAPRKKVKQSSKQIDKSIEDLEAIMNKKFSSKNHDKKNTDYVKEYYDEDDEGYESNVDSVEVSPSQNQGIFGFRKETVESIPTVSSQTVTSDTLPTTQPKEETPKKKKEVLQPILNSDGNPKELTLDSISTPMNQEDDDKDYPKSFEEMSLHPDILSNLKKLKCHSPLYVQSRSYNAIYDKENHNNIILATSTGSGKTLAFLLPIVQRCIDTSSNKNINTMILVPGRELASQIYNIALDLLQGYDDLKVGLCIGGTSYQRNVEMLRKKRPNIIVGTPGRVHELLFGKINQSPKIKLNPNGGVHTLVLDEFDELFSNNKYDRESSLDSYTKTATKEIYNYFNSRLGKEKRQVIFCSATALFQTNAYKKNQLLDDNWKVIKQKSNVSLNPTTKHGIIQTSKMKKIEMIRRIVNTEPNPQQVIIFVNHVSDIDVIVNALKESNIIAVPLHAGTTSEKGTASQERALITKELREGYIGIVVTTELVARGLDAPYLTHVINYDIPTNSMHYVHRIGRVGRNGRKGIVLNLVENNFEEGIYKRFGNELGLLNSDGEGSGDCYICICEPRGGKLVILRELF